jgi:1-acyl-sn-glycerol-3-phosphate acyltransferase
MDAIHAAPPQVDGAASALQQLVRETAAECRPGPSQPVGLDDSLEQAGIDSLARAQLLVRIERRFGVRVPDEVGLHAATARELLDAIVAAPRLAPAALAPGAAPEATTETLELPSQAVTLADVLVHHATRRPDRVHLVFHRDEGAPYDALTYGELLAEAGRVAAGLQREGVLPDDTVSIMLPTGREYFLAFFGVLLAGAVPVPIYPPAGRQGLEVHLRRQTKILANARAVALVTDAALLRVARLVQGSLGGLRVVTTVTDLAAGAAAPPVPGRRADDLALIQYTSGSTGDPKGVALSNANLLANIRVIGRALRVDAATDVCVTWLPLYHDMGLIGAWLAALYHGVRVVVLSPLAFIARPRRWLEAIHVHRGTLSAAPNFAYGLCATKLDDTAVADLDLSSWRVALNGSEPVSARTLDAFARRFAPRGFRPEAMTPVYGLAECSLALCFPPLGRGPRVDRVRRDDLTREGRAAVAAPDDANALEVVSCGQPLPGNEVRVVDESGREAPEREVGRVEMRGPSTTRGYRDNEAATRALLRGDGWLDTGDCGYLAGGELFLTGRKKDLVIRAGRKFFPSELEAAVTELPGVRKGGVVVFASSTARGDGAEQLVVVAETTLPERDAVGRTALCERIAALALELLQVPADVVELVPPRSVPKTANGKIRRSACRELWEQGQLGRAGAPVAVQVARLVLTSLGPRARRAGRRLASLAFGAWAWLLVGLLTPPAWLMAVVLPTLRARRAVVRGFARALFLLAGVPIDVRGRERLPSAPCVVVSNHASYLDSILLFALLPPRFAFVAKRELASAPLLGLALRRLGVVFVERHAAHEALEDTSHLVDPLRRGDSLALFAEGTFGRAPGLLPFHMGGFVAAARAGVPVVPLALKGTRTLLRGDERWPRRGPLTVSIAEAVQPGGGAWEDALALRDATRAAIAREGDEPDLLR